ncbi:MAG: hypothetical protein KGY99_08235 [Phycisphaerae bacterium]|nr:hypothetical protein [Phycisphaerae bacterium]
MHKRMASVLTVGMLLAITAVAARADAAAPDDPAGAPDDSAPAWLRNPVGRLFEPVNQLGIGTFSGKVQFLAMRRDYDGQDAGSGTLATTIRYRSPEYHNIRFGAEYIWTPRLFEGGCRDEPPNPGWVILNDDFHVLSEAYVDVGLAAIGLDRTRVIIGRQKSEYDFAPAYPIRQKAQYIEGVVLKCRQFEHLSVDVGHIERFSSWSTRSGRGDWLRAGFNDVEDIVADYESDSRIREANTGMQFVSATTDAIPRVTLTVYDLYGCDLYNTLGLKADVALYKTDTASVTWKNHYIMQRETGSCPVDIDADVIESSLAVQAGNLLVEPGIISTCGGNDARNDFRHPFESTLTWQYTLLWNTRAHLAGSDSVYLKSKYTFGKNLLYFLGMATCHENNVNDGSTDYELNAVYKYTFTDNFSVTLKAGWAHRNYGNGDSPEYSDLRLFVTYSF